MVFFTYIKILRTLTNENFLLFFHDSLVRKMFRKRKFKVKYCFSFTDILNLWFQKCENNNQNLI